MPEERLDTILFIYFHFSAFFIIQLQLDEMEECLERERKLKERLKDIQEKFLSSEYFAKGVYILLNALWEVLRTSLLTTHLLIFYCMCLILFLFIKGKKMDEIMNNLAEKNAQIYIKRSMVCMF